MTIKEYKSLFDQLYVSLCLLSNKYLEDLDVAKDVVQDVFLKIWEDKIEFQNINNTKAYLYTSVKNKSLDYLKQYKTTDFLPAGKLEKIETESFFFREVGVIEASSIVKKAIHGAVTDSNGGGSATKSSGYNVVDFNTYGIIWTANKIEFYLNGA